MVLAIAHQSLSRGADCGRGNSTYDRPCWGVQLVVVGAERPFL